MWIEILSGREFIIAIVGTRVSITHQWEYSLWSLVKLSVFSVKHGIENVIIFWLERYYLDVSQNYAIQFSTIFNKPFIFRQDNPSVRLGKNIWRTYQIKVLWTRIWQKSQNAEKLKRCRFRKMALTERLIWKVIFNKSKSCATMKFHQYVLYYILDYIYIWEILYCLENVKLIDHLCTIPW